MGMNESTFIHRNSINPYPANVENMVSSNASKWQMGFKFGKFMGMNESTFIHRNSINPYPANVENMVSS